MSNIDFRGGLERAKKKLTVKNRRALLLILGGISALVTFVAVYFFLMPINLSSGGFKFYLVLMGLIWSVPLIFKSEKSGVRPKIKSGWGAPFLFVFLFVTVLIILAIAVSPLFMAEHYGGLLYIETDKNFTETVQESSSTQLPVADAALAAKLGEKKLGEDNLGSQFEIDPNGYTLTKYKDFLYWVAPIEYRGFFQWTSNAASPGYIMIKATDPSDIRLVRDELRYVRSAYLWNDLARKTYFSNMFRYREGRAHLEIGDNDTPYFIEAVLERRFVFTGGVDTVGVIVTNARTAESRYYDINEAPNFIDCIQPISVMERQLRDWGKYRNGFFNSMFAKRDVLRASAGVSYIYSRGDIYLQTGMTGAGSGQSIAGVAMIDMRTKGALFMNVAGATESAAAQAALGVEQSQRFSATAPVMINFKGVPTYFLMLKDDEGLVKRYAYVNAADYSIAVTHADKTAAAAAYEIMISPASVLKNLPLTIAAIRSVVVDNTTCFYIKFVYDETVEELPSHYGWMIFKAPLALGPHVAFLQAGDRVSADILLDSEENLITRIELAV